MSIAAGRLRHQVRIEELVDVIDSSGEPVRDPQGEFLKEWVEVATVWAAIEPLSAREFIQSASLQSQITAKIIIRKRDGLDPSMQLVHMVNGVPATYYDPAGFLADKDSGREYLTIPVSLALNRGT